MGVGKLGVKWFRLEFHHFGSAGCFQRFGTFTVCPPETPGEVRGGSGEAGLVFNIKGCPDDLSRGFWVTTKNTFHHWHSEKVTAGSPKSHPNEMNQVSMSKC